MKTKKTQNQKKPGKGAPLRRWIVEWLADDNSRCMAFPNLARARGYAKELADSASRLITGGHDEDGGLAALVESIRIYAAVLVEVEDEGHDSKRTTARGDSKRTTARR